MAQLQTEDQDQEGLPMLSEVIADIEEVVGEENLLAPQSGRDFPQLRVQVDGTFVFVSVRGLDDETVEELEELDFVERTSSRDSYQVRVYYEAIADAQ